MRQRQRQQAQVQAEPSLQVTVQPSPLALGVQVAGGKGAVDIFGNQVQPVALDQVSCPNCGRPMAAGRFAPHLEKCMGRGRHGSQTVAARGANT